MAWIESHTVLARHRKVMQLAESLRVDIPQTIGHLHILWHAVLEQQEDGDLSKWSDSVIAQMAMWKGDPSEFVAHLREHGWIDGHLIHDWIDYTGHYLMKKYSSGKVEFLKQIWAKHGYKYGKGNGKYTRQQVSKKRVEGERKETLPHLSSPHPSVPNRISPDLTEPEEGKEKSCGQAKVLPAVSKSASTWDAYASAYRVRYRVNPVRNRQTNSMLCRLVDKLGLDEAPQVAAFYLTLNTPFYVTKRHPPNLLVMDAEGLRTQWATGVKATTSEAKNAELKDDVIGQVQRVTGLMKQGGVA